VVPLRFSELWPSPWNHSSSPLILRVSVGGWWCAVCIRSLPNSLCPTEKSPWQDTWV
jgi:hypothetical protein